MQPVVGSPPAHAQPFVSERHGGAGKHGHSKLHPERHIYQPDAQQGQHGQGQKHIETDGEVFPPGKSLIRKCAVWKLGENPAEHAERQKTHDTARKKLRKSHLAGV